MIIKHTVINKLCINRMKSRAAISVSVTPAFSKKNGRSFILVYLVQLLFEKRELVLF